VIVFALVYAAVPASAAVTIDTLMDTPIVQVEPVMSAEGAPS